jgi:hypothetical protein
MKSLVFLLSFLIAFPVFSQSIFSAGMDARDNLEKVNTVIITEVVFKDLTIETQDVTIGVAKTINNKKETYDVWFFGTGDKFYYDKGYIQINDFDILIYDKAYLVTIYYSNYEIYPETRTTESGSSYEVVQYTQKYGQVGFVINKYGVK